MSRSRAERYRRACQFREPDVADLVTGVTLRPNWLDGDRFWFDQAGPPSTTVVVDPDGSTVGVADVAAQIDAGAPLPVPGRLRSPDGTWDVLRRAGNVAVRPSGDPDGAVCSLTTDAEPWWDYAGTPDTSMTAVTLRRSGDPQTPVALWSPDSTRLLTHRIDQRRVREMDLVESAPAVGVAPVRHPLRVPLPGDDERPTAELVVFEVGSGNRLALDTGPLPVDYFSPLELGWVWWGADSGSVWYLTDERGARRLTLRVADLQTGTSRLVVDECSPQYVETHPLLPWPGSVRMVPGDRRLVWPSERDGWRHLYLYDAVTGSMVRQLTSGAWVVRDVLHVDDDWVWFTGLGREPGRDPYLRHLYRVALGGGEPELLTPEEADHAISFSPSGRHFVDTASTVATAPAHRLRRADGEHLRHLGDADLCALESRGWRPPEAFEIPAADGQTPLYGALFFPSDFDPAARYPVIDSIYPGPQLLRTPKSFTVDSTAGPDEWPGPWDAQALAELGFVVMTLDGRGTPLRSRRLHLASYGHLGRHTLDDHVSALRSLAATREWLDLDRIGIFGHSAGGAAAVRAVLDRPEVFKAAASGSGVHDLRRYLAYWAEKYQGLQPEADYLEASNIERAHLLERPLLLMHGELDDNVHPANTLALVDALVKADKDFELVILPGQNHNCATHPYYQRRVWAFFVRHLLGADLLGAEPVGAEPPLGAERVAGGSSSERTERALRSRQ